uniref:Intraflagellar transport protein 74 homolog n=1 Tax=Cacopsylla melanoneura TaxID=428564 RepID=A0A8D8LT51_9HEMI
MDKKIKLEIESLNEKISNMRKDIVVYEDIDGLKTKAEDKRSNLVKEKQSLLEEKEILLGEQEKVRKSLQDLQSQLDQNDSYIQLVNQEKRLAQIEQTNYTLDEFIKNKLSETNFIPVRDKCLERVQEYNALLKLSYQYYMDRVQCMVEIELPRNQDTVGNTWDRVEEYNAWLKFGMKVTFIHHTQHETFV